MEHKKMLLKMLNEICKELGYTLDTYGDGWLAVISSSTDKKMFIYGYRFPNNDASMSELCTDKSSLSEYLRRANIPCIPHFYVDSIDENYLWVLLYKYHEMVIKPNNGTGGKDVIRVKDSLKKLTAVLKKAINKHGMVALSPYVDIQAEFRTIVLNGKPLFTFEKIRPSIEADGFTSFNEYLESFGYKEGLKKTDYIPEKGERILLNWKHNLQGGAKPQLLENLNSGILELINRLNEVFDIKFASIDIVKVDGKYYVLEINSGVMTECFASCSPQYYELAKNAYKLAVIDYFNR